MRNIEFRGKRIDTGEWIYGWLVNNKNDDCGIELKMSFTTYIVVKETVGQYTTGKDKNGKKMYKGDIVRRGRSIGLIEWDGLNYCWIVTWKKRKDGMDMLNGCEKKLEIIGNIYDNPELKEE